MAEETWRVSTYCGTNACVEIAVGASAVQVRRSNDPDGARLTFDRPVWRAFLAELRAGQLDTSE